MTFAIHSPRVHPETRLLEASAPVPVKPSGFQWSIENLTEGNRFDEKIVADALTNSVFFIIEVLARRFFGSFMSCACIDLHRSNYELLNEK